MILQPFNFAGGKGCLTDWIYRNFPNSWKSMHYVEPFGGSGAVLLNKERQKYETYNDKSDLLVNYLFVVREKPDKLKRLLELTPYSRKEYLRCLAYIKKVLKGKKDRETPLQESRRLLVVLQQGLQHSLDQSPGQWRGHPDLEKSSSANVVKTYLNKIEMIPQISDRLKGVALECLDWKAVVKKYDKKDTFLFMDPPYWGNRKKLYGLNEIDHTVHVDIAKTLLQFKGSVMLCGRNEQNHLYDKLLHGWHKVMKKTKRNIGHRLTSECLWMNYEKQNLLIGFSEEPWQAEG